ncbi:unnamed protein product [Clonostachys rhizophaga]|uniref:Dienelactone hydrolase domain-containing protein n=1 Tax=Clonostachys rhizophaga TaxID=160324 RepID=A0A9N9VVJ9_9HYPO|nr:unnamed protein product [Clonostachys rhizophaga]
MHGWSSKTLLSAGRSLGQHSRFRIAGALQPERHHSIAPQSSDGAKRSRGLKTLHWGTPSGKDIKIENKIAAYLASPESGSISHRNCGLIYVPNVFGIWQTSKLMADAFASKGYPCLILDIFNGDPVPLKMPENFDLNGWIAHGSDGNNPHTAEQIDPIIIAGINYMKGLGFSKIGAAGYCFGAKYVVRNYSHGIQCAFLAHPSFVENSEFARISGPLSIAAAGVDEYFPNHKRHETEGILKTTGQEYQINLFGAVGHGFAVRADPEDRAQRFAKEQVFNQALVWFNHHLGEG